MAITEQQVMDRFFARFVERFPYTFPYAFDDPGYLEQERNYKWNAHRRVEAELLSDDGRRRVAEGPPDDLMDTLKTLIRSAARSRGRAPMLSRYELTLAGLRRYLVFFVITLQSRRVAIAEIHQQPDGAWMEQLARNLTDPVDGWLRSARYLIHDRDPLYTLGQGAIAG